MNLWPWQEHTLKRVPELIDEGFRRIAVATPTGMGKGQSIAELAKIANETLIYTNRRLLTGQSGRVLNNAGIPVGFIAANFSGSEDARVKIASVQTVRTRKIDLPKCDLVIIDECHRNDFDFILEGYKDTGIPVVGFTATPVGLKGKYETLLVAGTKSEGRKHNALVPCFVFAPTEPDLQGVRLESIGETKLAKRVMQCVVFGDIFDHWYECNTESLPTLLWAPGIPESRWFVEQFNARGVTAEHIDGETSDEERKRIIEGSRTGEIKVVSSYGVLREGVDMPWVAYGILVQVCRDISTFLQIVGRLLRASPGKAKAILQDHSGAFHRHCSPNEDIEWVLGDTDKSLRKAQKDARERGLVKCPKCKKRHAPGPACPFCGCVHSNDTEPIVCPQCSGVRAGGTKCPHCGHEHQKSVRMVRTIEGQLVKQVGKVTKKKAYKSDEQKAWSSCLYAGARRNMTLRQCWGMYYKRFNSAPKNVHPMPAEGSLDWEQRAGEIYPWLMGKKKVKA